MNISADDDRALRGVLVKLCEDMLLGIFVQCQITSLCFGRFEAVSERLRNTVAIESQCAQGTD
jgi:hypothetical protein